MTQTLRRAPRRDPNVRRKGSIYLFVTLRVHETGPQAGLVLDGSTEDGYVGKTRQTLAQREQQHRGGAAYGEPIVGEDLEEQAWWDISVGGIRLLEQGMWTDDELHEREQYWIDRLEPRYNYQLNRSPRRFPKYTAREHRDNRDRAKGLERRQWPPFSTQRTRPPAPSPTPARRAPAAVRRRNTVLGYAGAWALQAGLWWALLAVLAHRWQVEIPGRVWPVLAGGLAGAPLMFGLRTRRHRKTAWTCLALATLIFAALAAR